MAINFEHLINIISSILPWAACAGMAALGDVWNNVGSRAGSFLGEIRPVWPNDDSRFALPYGPFGQPKRPIRQTAECQIVGGGALDCLLQSEMMRAEISRAGKHHCRILIPIKA